jgi:hypothetical protein
MKIKKAWLLSTDGGAVRLTSLEGKELSLQTMYPFVGATCSTIEHVGLEKGVDMWVDEDGIGKELEYNQTATDAYRKAFPGVPDLHIVGNAIITDNTKAGNYLDKLYV